MTRRGILSHRKTCVKRVLQRANESKVETRKEENGELRCEICLQSFRYSKCLHKHLVQKHSNKQEQFEQYNRCIAHVEKSHPELKVDREDLINLSQTPTGSETLQEVQSSEVCGSVRHDRTQPICMTVLEHNPNITATVQLNSTSKESLQPKEGEVHLQCSSTVVCVPTQQVQQKVALVSTTTSTYKTASHTDHTSSVAASLPSLAYSRELSKFVPISPRPAAPISSTNTNHSRMHVTKVGRGCGVSNVVASSLNKSDDVPSLSFKRTKKQFTLNEVPEQAKEETGLQAIAALRRLSRIVGELELNNPASSAANHVENQGKGVP